MSLAEFETPRRRLAILAALSFSAGYRVSLRTLRDQVEAIGYVASPSRITTDCAWLAEQGQLAVVNGIALLNDSGLATVRSWSIIPGIHQPLPNEIADMKQMIIQAGIHAAQAALRGE